ncbi:MAG: insulinase family protein [Alphaproteobacteria bacterium]|nr:MAG: insulinase family protein [Alphaproteobacteria bacterium]
MFVSEKLRRLALVAFAVLAWAGCALAAAAAEVSHFSLDNGLEVVVLEDHRAPVVVHMVWYRAGAADEPPGRSGIAHFLEHLLFKGTDELAPGEFSQIVARQGGSDNAFTSWDFTAYFQRVASDRLELMMKMEADRMRDLRLRPEDIATERDVIIEERNQRVENDPGRLFQEQKAAAQFLNHPYGRPVIGWKHEAEALTLEDALAFYRRFYAPNNAIVIVAGDVEPEEVRALAERHYGPLEPTPGLGPRARPQEPPQTAARRLTFRDARVGQPYVTRSYLAPVREPGDQRQAAALMLFAELLGGDPQTSVLARKLQFEQKVALYTSASYDAVAYDPSTFGLAVVPAPGVSLAEAEAALDRALAGFLEEGVDEAQLARVKMQLHAQEIYGQDSLQGLARRYGAALASGLTLADIEAWPEIVQSVTAEEIIAAARAVLVEEHSVTGWLMRPEDGPANGAARMQGVSQ